MLRIHLESHNFPLGVAILTLNHQYQYLIRYKQRIIISLSKIKDNIELQKPTKYDSMVQKDIQQK